MVEDLAHVVAAAGDEGGVAGDEGGGGGGDDSDDVDATGGGAGDGLGVARTPDIASDGGKPAGMLCAGRILSIGTTRTCVLQRLSAAHPRTASLVLARTRAPRRAGEGACFPVLWRQPVCARARACRVRGARVRNGFVISRAVDAGPGAAGVDRAGMSGADSEMCRQLVMASINDDATDTVRGASVGA